jgi:hypothetical protein
MSTLFTFQPKAGIVEQLEAVILVQWHGKHISVATDTDITIEDAVFYMWAVPCLLTEDLYTVYKEEFSITCYMCDMYM